MIAVENQLGGPESRLIADWMVSTTCDFFQQNDGLQSWEVGDYLAEMVSNEFRTELEDGSPDEIGTLLCRFYSLLKESKLAELESELQKLPKCNLALCRVEEPNEEADEVQSEPESINLQNLNIEDSSGSSQKDKEPIVDEEGFTLVRKSKRK